MTQTQNASPAPAAKKPEEVFGDSWLSPIKGLDYIVDYYAVLGVSRTATTEEIHAAFRKEGAQWHPDRMASAPEELRKRAERRFQLLQEADEALTDPLRRAKFDQLLATFPAELISEDGTPIINLRRRRVNLQLLLNGAERDVSEQTERLKALSGYDENTYKLLEQLVQAAGKTAAPELLEAYKTAAEKRYVYLSLQEEITAMAVGLENQPAIKGITTPEEHVAGRKEQLREIAETAVSSLKSITTLLPGGEATRLLCCPELNPSGQNALQPASSAELETRLRERLALVEERLVGAAEKTAQAGKALLALTKWHYVPVEPTELFPALFIVVVLKDKVALTVQWAEDGGSIRCNMLDWGKGLSPEEGAKAVQLQAGVQSNVAVLEPNHELDMLMQLTFVMRKHFEKKSGEAVELTRDDSIGQNLGL